MQVILSLLVAWCFERAHMIIAAPNYGAVWNGFGAIDLTVQRNIKQPAAYRVLIPLLVVGIEKLFRTPRVRRLDIYQTLKLAMETLAFWALWQAWGLPVALLVFMLLVLTITYDYWSWAIELAAVGMAMTGDFTLALVGAVLFGLSRETALISGLAYYAATGNLVLSLVVGVAAVLTQLGVRLWVGYKPPYSDRFMIHIQLKPFRIWGPNWDMFKPFFKFQPIFHSDPFIALTLTALALAAVLHFPAGWYIPLMVLAAGWTMARAEETRVFTLCLPWIAAWLLAGVY